MRLFSSIRSRLALLAMVCVLPVWLAAGFFVLHSYQDKRAVIERHMIETARALAMAVDQLIASMVSALEALSTSSAIRRGDLAEFQHQAEELVSHHHGFNIVLADAEGWQVVNTIRPFGDNVQRRSPLQSVQRVFEAGVPVISNLYHGAVSRTARIGVDVPVWRDGKVIYDVSMGVPVEQFQAILIQQHLPPDWIGAISDASATLVARNRSPGKFVGGRASAPLLAAMSKSAEGVLDMASFEGEDCIFSFSQSSQYGFAVVIGAPKDTILADLYRWLWLAVAGTLALSLIGIVSAIMIARGIARSVHGLIGPAQALGHGEEVTVPPLALLETDKVGQALTEASGLLRERDRRIQESECRFRHLADTVPVLIWLADTDGRCFYVNKPWLEFTGRTLEQEQSHGRADDIHPDDRAPCLETYFRCFEARQPLAMEYRLRRHDGVYRWFYDQGAPRYDADGEFLGYVGGCINISERKVAEERMIEARQTAEAASRTKSIFLAMMSHELRTPMNAIMGMAHLALRTGMTPRQRDYVGKINIAAKSLLSVINDILDFSKIEAGRLDVERLPFDLTHIIENSLLMVRERAVMNEIELLLEVDPRLTAQPWLDGDGMRLGQVLNNLLSNAVKFTHHGYVRLSIDVTRDTETSRTVLFAVKDTGIGLSAEQRERLFQEFSQADGSITRQFGGTGLGLAICKRLVALMGGAIEVESAEGRGSTFSFSLVFGRSERAVRRWPRLLSAAPVRALVVDDVPEAAQALVSALAGFGVAAETAGSGEEALTRLKAAVTAGAPFSLAFVDWVMPLESGGHVMARIRRGVTPCPDLIVVSAYDTDAIHDALSSLGASHFLAKPVLPDALSRLLSSLAGFPEDALADGAGPACGEDSEPCFPGMRVLLTEDNLINQQVALELLRSAGIEADLAANGQEAIDCLSRKAPDHYHLVLMDLEMPVLDGLEATRLLRADPRFRGLPVVAMTAHALTETRDRCLALGMVGHLTKPIDTGDFFAVLAEHYQRAKGLGTLAPAFRDGDAGGGGDGEPPAVPAAFPGEPKEAAPPLTALSILVAEDDPIIQMVVAGLLERAGAAVTLAPSGLEAVERASIQPFDLVLMDVHMPGIGGVEATRRIRALPDATRAAVPIIALTASVSREDTDLYQQSGMNAVVAKPLRGPELVEAIINQLAASRQAGEPPLMDEFAVAQWVAKLGAKQTIRIMRLLPDQARTATAGIRADLAGGDLASLAEKAHALAGATGTIGVQRLSLEAKALERAARAGDLGRCATLFGSLEATLETSLSALQAMADRLVP